MKLFQFVPDGNSGCLVEAYLQEQVMESRPLPAIVICPGGGYGMVSDREASPVAKEYLAAGYHAFVLTYSTGADAAGFRPLSQLADTICHIRKQAAEWHVDPEKIAVCGFSAGGHLAASSGTLFSHPKFLSAWNRQENMRPNAMILCYPVILANEYAHQYSIENVSGAQKNDELYRFFGLDQHVSEATPPTFLWHTASDAGVPAENSLAFAAALSQAKVPYELHIFPKGRHGMSVCTQEVATPDAYNRRWVDWSIQWLNRLFDFCL